VWLPRDDRHLFFAIRAKGFHPRLAILLLHKIVFPHQPNVMTRRGEMDNLHSIATVKLPQGYDICEDKND
jgi:hypothetical protein